MKLFLLIILLCGITSTPCSVEKENAKKEVACNQKMVTNFDMVPSGLFFQF